MRFIFALLSLSLALSSCSLVTVPIGAAGRVASATVKATGGVAKAGFGAMGRSSQNPAAPAPQPPQQHVYPQQPYPYPQQQYAPQYPPQQYAPQYPPQQQAYPPQQPQGYWYQGRWYPYAQQQRR